jgi:hypothetical protein
VDQPSSSRQLIPPPKFAESRTGHPRYAAILFVTRTFCAVAACASWMVT